MARIAASGYVQRILDKKMTFEQAVWEFARGMGALVTMRDDPADAPIPERFEPSEYHTKARAKEELRLAHLMAMSDDDRLAEGERLKIESVSQYIRRNDEQKPELERVEELIGQVHLWNPPTADHVGLRDFMLEQLSMSLGHDDSGYWIEEARKAREKSALDYFYKAVETAAHGVEYHTKEHAKEVEWVKSRNIWLKQLRDSLSQLNAPTA